MSDAAATSDDAAPPAESATMSRVDYHVALGKQAVAAALAAQPFRAIPSWEDLHTAIEAVLRFVIGGPPAPADIPPAADPPLPANDQTEPPAAA